MTLEPTSVSLSHLLEKNFEMTVKVREFSNDEIHCPGREGSFTEYSPEFEEFEDIFNLTVHANGINDENKGWVLLLFEPTKFFDYIIQTYDYFESSFVVSVIDTSGNKRFLRSFSYDRNSLIEAKSSFIIEQYIERNTLLAEPLDYLPEDCATLNMDVSFKANETHTYELLTKFVEPSFTVESCIHGTRRFLSLDSDVAENLKEASDFFRFISETPMKEGITRRMDISVEEYLFFKRIGHVLMGSNFITVESFEDICVMFFLADKYLIPVATKICRGLVISFLLFQGDSFIVEGIPRDILLELAEKHEDLRLKEIVESYSNIEESLNVERKNLIKEEDIEEETGWKVEPFKFGSFLNFSLSKVFRNYEHVSDHDFYS